MKARTTQNKYILKRSQILFYLITLKNKVFNAFCLAMTSKNFIVIRQPYLEGTSVPDAYSEK